MRTNNKGFTLIELLVVIAIIALLMSILMPALRNVRDQAKNSMCLQRLQQWGVINSMYAGEYDGHLPGYNFYAGMFMEHAWVNRLYPYAQDFEVYLCPAAIRLWGYGEAFDSPLAAWDFQYIVAGEPSAGEWYPYYNLGTIADPIFAYGSYGENAWVADSCFCDENYHDHENYFRTVRVKDTSRIPVLGDANWAGGFPYGEDGASETEIHGPVDGPNGEMDRYNINRHNYSVNFVFLDWSVRKVGLRQLWVLKWSDQKTEGARPVSVWGNLNIVPDWNDPLQWPEWMRKSKNYDL
ncbi:MAG: prepilin-type N-terminal cleavage/methylation domain-containing protein [Planctomycetota bacterium]|jgi:prepilin-type N-terminal cleavage/methylation domain-containing protein